MYFYLGNCKSESECTNGIINDGIKRCQCIVQPKCYYCSSDSISKGNLCESCQSGYYQKQDDTTNVSPYFNCYNEATISDGYYLNSNLYVPCYPLCKKCNQYGSISDNKCTVCIDGYSLVINNHNIENCYPNCSHYIYFDSDVFHCTDDEKCPCRNCRDLRL